MDPRPRPRPKPWRVLGTALACALAAVAARPARADPAAPKGLVTIRAITGGGPDFLGLEVNLDTLRPVELEGGAALGLVASSIFVRVGYDLVTLPTRDAGDRFGVFHLVLLAGPRGATFDATGAPAIGLDTLVGFDYTLWLSRRFAVDTELVGGATSWITAPAVFGRLWANVSVLFGIGF